MRVALVRKSGEVAVLRTRVYHVADALLRVDRGPHAEPKVEALDLFEKRALFVDDPNRAGLRAASRDRLRDDAQPVKRVDCNSRTAAQLAASRIGNLHLAAFLRLEVVELDARVDSGRSAGDAGLGIDADAVDVAVAEAGKRFRFSRLQIDDADHRMGVPAAILGGDHGLIRHRVLRNHRNAAGAKEVLIERNHLGRAFDDVGRDHFGRRRRLALVVPEHDGSRAALVLGDLRYFERLRRRPRSRNLLAGHRIHQSVLVVVKEADVAPDDAVHHVIAPRAGTFSHDLRDFAGCLVEGFERDPQRAAVVVGKNAVAAVLIDIEAQDRPDQLRLDDWAHAIRGARAGANRRRGALRWGKIRRRAAGESDEEYAATCERYGKSGPG